MTDIEHYDRRRDFKIKAGSYHHFMLGAKWAAISVASILTFLIVGFATPASVIAGLIAGAVVFAVGVYALRHGLAHSTEYEVEPPP